MTDAIRPASPASIFGIFLIVGGAGVILDGDWLWRGVASIATGVAFLVGTYRSHGSTR
jgi:hypothetical protein